MARSKKKSPPDPLWEMDNLLRRGTRLIDSAAKLVIPAGMHKKNIRRLGEALVKVFEVQDKIYDYRPELLPHFLKNRDRFMKRRQNHTSEGVVAKRAGPSR